MKTNWKEIGAANIQCCLKSQELIGQMEKTDVFSIQNIHWKWYLFSQPILQEALLSPDLRNLGK